MKRLALALMLMLGIAPAFATQKSPAAIKTEINAQITSNGVGAITGSQLNGILLDIADSYGDISCTQFPLLSGAVTTAGGSCTTALGAFTNGYPFIMLLGTVTGAVTLQYPTGSTAYNYNFPLTAGAVGQPLLSGGGGSNAQTYALYTVMNTNGFYSSGAANGTFAAGLWMDYSGLTGRFSVGTGGGYAWYNGATLASTQLMTLSSSGALTVNSIPSPGPIGGATPGTGAFTSITATSGLSTSGIATAAFGAGLWMDYTTNLGRFSVGTASGAFAWYNGVTLAATPIMTLSSGGVLTVAQLGSTVATGTPPFTVASTTNVANLNAALLNGTTFAAPGPIGSGTPSTGAFTAASATSGLSLTGVATATFTAGLWADYTTNLGRFSVGSGAGFAWYNGATLALTQLASLSSTGTLTVPGQLASTVATGTAPLSVVSTTNVPNLNASSLNGATFSAPGAIGGGTPGTGAFTTITESPGAAWTTWTPTVTCSTGTPTTASATGRYRQLGKTLFFAVEVTITTVGTCAASVLFTLPNAVTANNPFYAPVTAYNRTTGVEGVGICVNASNTVSVVKYDGTTFAGSGVLFYAAGSCEVN